MTNWMTAAGIAFIAGGLATLISLRSVLFGGGKGRRDRQAVRPPAADTPAEPADDHQDSPPDARPDHLRGLGLPGLGPDDDPGGLASIGLSAEDDGDLTAEPDHEPDYEADPLAEPMADPLADPLAEPIGQLPPEGPEPAEPEPEPIEDERAADRRGTNASYTLIIPSHRPAAADSIVDFPAPPDPVAVTPDDETSRPISVRRVDRSDRRYGDRIAGWIRPEYHDDPPQPPSGEYWTPVPMDDLDFDLAEDDPEPSAKGYGWPILVERLPAVPDYEPATGFDLAPVPAEPTEVVPIWPPDRRVRLPRSGPARNEKPGDNRFFENEPGPRRRKNYDEADQRCGAPTGEPERRRPRPRPRPGPDPDNVYVSRHAAEPPR